MLRLARAGGLTAEALNCRSDTVFYTASLVAGQPSPLRIQEDGKIRQSRQVTIDVSL